MATSSSQDGSPLDATFDAFVKQSLEEWHVPGMSIAVLDGEKTFAKGYGMAAFPDKPVTPETLFYTASTTKAFTSAAVSLLIDEEVEARATSAETVHPTECLTWKSRMCNLIPDDFVLPDPYATIHTTIEDALSHRTGMPDHEKSFGPGTTSVKEMVRKLRNLPLSAELRADFQYNNMMYTAVSHIIETRTGKVLGDYLRERIWNPLEMRQTYWTMKEALDAEEKGAVQLARGYAWDSESGQFVSESLPDYIGVSGAGAIISNVLDYAKWLRCMMTRSAPLSPAGHASIVEPRMVAASAGSNTFPGTHLYALGWYVDMYRGETVIWHAGGWTGFGSVMAYLPNRQWGFAMVGNTSKTSNYVQVILYFFLLDELLGILLAERTDWDAWWKGVINERRQNLANSRQRLYPSVPAKSIAPSLALEEYTGSYWHPAYGAMNIVLDGQALGANRLEQEIPMQFKFEHVSGEFWLAFLYVLNRDPLDAEAVRAEFYVSAPGKAIKLGIDFEPKMKGTKIWFLREGY
ncbi:MAG: hypothetical protein M1818_003681 [Claussenomyces sp. TS43310]|nr:MAG: hypothetical protein M1818_003681 [Claussenomyces sp. TS43310]